MSLKTGQGKAAGAHSWKRWEEKQEGMASFNGTPGSKAIIYTQNTSLCKRTWELHSEVCGLSKLHILDHLFHFYLNKDARDQGTNASLI